MLKRVIVEKAVHAMGEAGASIQVPAGKCWVMERPSWSSLIWSEGGARRAADLPARAYDVLQSQGVIRVASPVMRGATSGTPSAIPPT